MSKLAHSDDATMAEIERNHARDNGDLRKCRTCEVESIVDDPECPLDSVHCEFFTVQPTATLVEDRS